MTDARFATWVVAMVGAGTTYGQCSPSWSAMSSGVQLQGTAWVFEMFDPDGAGPLPASLHVGGSLNSAPSLPLLLCVARWTGNSWGPLGQGVWGGGPPGWGFSAVYGMRAFDHDGPGPAPGYLYVAGGIGYASGLTVYRIARWDGAAWSAVGTGIQGNEVRALHVHDADGAGPGAAVLYAGGEFSGAGGVPSANIAGWDGTAWFALGTGVGGIVRALETFDDDGPGPNPPALYAAGQFATAGGAPANLIARWDGLAWTALGDGLTGGPRVYDLTVFDDDGPGPMTGALYAVGNFQVAGTVSAPGIARWDGDEWTGLGSGFFEASAVAGSMPTGLGRAQRCCSSGVVRSVVYPVASLAGTGVPSHQSVRLPVCSPSFPRVSRRSIRMARGQCRPGCSSAVTLSLSAVCRPGPWRGWAVRRPATRTATGIRALAARQA